MMFFYESVIFMFIFFFLSVIYHETGHFLRAKKLGYKPIKTFKGVFPLVIVKGFVSPGDDRDILIGGLLLGLIPIVAGYLVINFFIVPVLVAYLMGVRHDLKRLVLVNKKIRGKRK